MADFIGKTLEINTENGIRIQGDRQALGRMINQLCDNAIKYSPDGDLIRIILKKSGREIRLTEENCMKEPVKRGTESFVRSLLQAGCLQKPGQRRIRNRFVHGQSDCGKAWRPDQS